MHHILYYKLHYLIFLTEGVLCLMYPDENQLHFLLKEHKRRCMSGKGSSKISCQDRNYLDCLHSTSIDSFRNKHF